MGQRKEIIGWLQFEACWLFAIVALGILTDFVTPRQVLAETTLGLCRDPCVEPPPPSNGLLV